MTAEPCHDWRVFGHTDPRCPATETPPARLQADDSVDHHLLSLPLRLTPVREPEPARRRLAAFLAAGSRQGPPVLRVTLPPRWAAFLAAAGAQRADDTRRQLGRGGRG